MTVDIAKKNDFYNIHVSKVASTIVKGTPALGVPDRWVHELQVVHIEKYQNILYKDGAKIVKRLAGVKELAGNYDLLVDATGVGDAAVETIRDEGLTPIPIVFTGGQAVREVTADFGATLKPATPGIKLTPLQVIKEIHVPKVDLVMAGKLLTEQHRVTVANGLRWGPDFKLQMSMFRGKVNEITKKIKYEALEEAIHDDQVVCFLMSAWWMDRITKFIKVADGQNANAELFAQALPPYATGGSHGQATYF